jgi:hypothetical protein
MEKLRSSVTVPSANRNKINYRVCKGRRRLLCKILALGSHVKSVGSAQSRKFLQSGYKLTRTLKHSTHAISLSWNFI